MSRPTYSIEFTGLSGLAGICGRVTGWLENAAVDLFRSPFGWLAVAVLAGFGAWMLLAADGGQPADRKAVRMAPAVAVPSSAAEAAPGGPLSNPLTAPAAALTEAAPVDGLRISSQYWRRGGLGSNALVTFTLRNRNDYAVKDVEISCAFSRKDGTHLTDRARLIHGIVNRKSRKIFARMHIGYVNINAEKAKCSLVAASHA